jgi:SAM-dependent methyltransferase
VSVARRLRNRTTLKARTAVRRALAIRYLRGEGIEIGALHLPLKLPRGATVRYVDRKTKPELQNDHPELADRIVDVDLVEDGERLGSVPDAALDFVIANHVLEHAEDPIGTIGHFLRVLRPSGIAFMAVPDKRRTFDRERPSTRIDHLVRDHRDGPTWSRASHYAEWVELVEGLPDPAAAERAAYAMEHGQCIHFHVWSRQEFVGLLRYCSTELALPMRVEGVYPNLSEFIAIVRRA